MFFLRAVPPPPNTTQYPPHLLPQYAIFRLNIASKPIYRAGSRTRHIDRRPKWRGSVVFFHRPHLGWANSETWPFNFGAYFGRPFGTSFWEAFGVTQNSALNSRVWPRPGQTLKKTQHSHAIWPSELAGAGLGPGPLILSLYFGTPFGCQFGLHFGNGFSYCQINFSRKM